MRGLLAAATALACAATFGCRSDDGPTESGLASAEGVAEMSSVVFDGARARADLLRFDSLGELETESRAAGKARSHIRDVLKRAGYEARDVETELEVSSEGAPPVRRTATHVLGRRKGASRDAILLLAPYGAASARRPGRAPASGAAVLLELARVEQQARDATGALPFTLLLGFVDGDGLGDRTPGAAPRAAWPGTDGFARWLVERTSNVNVRLVLWIDDVGASPLAVARDLQSNRAYRETFFGVGESLGLQPTFDARRPVTTPTGAQAALRALGLGPLVALVGESHAVASPPVVRSATPPTADAAGRDGLVDVGEVAWVGLVEISDRLARIDAFRADPLVGGPGELELPGTDPGPAPAEDAGAAPTGEGDAAAAKVPAAPR